MTRSIPLLRRRTWLACLGLAPWLQACSPLGLINATVSRDTHTVRLNQAYGSHPRQQADVYLPLNAPAGAPIAVFFYGGSWSSGERADYRFVGEALASRGVVTVVADYRVSPEVGYPAFVQDSALALRWARDNTRALGASEQRLYVVGHSAGAYNAAMLALDPRWLAEVQLAPTDLAGWVGLAGPYDFLPIGVPEVQRAFAWPNTPADSQPLFHAKANQPHPVRTLLLAALEDSMVNPQRNSVGLATALRERGADVQLALFGGVSHATLIGAMARPLRGLAPVLSTASAFLNQPSA